MSDCTVPCKTSFTGCVSRNYVNGLKRLHIDLCFPDRVEPEGALVANRFRIIMLVLRQVRSVTVTLRRLLYLGNERVFFRKRLFSGSFTASEILQHKMIVEDQLKSSYKSVVLNTLGRSSFAACWSSSTLSSRAIHDEEGWCTDWLQLSQRFLLALFIFQRT